MRTESGIELRMAIEEDAAEVADILCEAFPALYQSAFGIRSIPDLRRLLTELYRNDFLVLGHVAVAERNGRIVGVMALNADQPLGHGAPREYFRLLRRTVTPFQAVRAFFGGIATNRFLGARIPHAPDLLYIEALAVRENERGHGIGSRLLERAAMIAIEQQRPRLGLHVLHRNEGAYRLYRKHGFVEAQALAQPTLFRLYLSAGNRRGRWTTRLMFRDLNAIEDSGRD